jgi:putative inorganic carbon (hco3(-)) transporter
MSSTPLTTYTLPLTPSERRLLLLLPLAVVACVLAAMYAPAALGIVCAVLVGVVFLDRPFPLLLLMVFLIPFNFVFTIGPIPVATELLKLFAWVPFILTSGTRDRFKASKYGKWFLVWGGILLLSLVRSNDLPYTVKESVRLASNIGLCYLVLNLVDTREKVLQIFRALAISTFLVACYGFYQFAIHDYGALFWIVNPRLDTSFSHGRFTFWEWRDRMISVLTSELELGHYFNLSLPLAVVVWLSSSHKRITSKWFFVVVALLAGLLLTFTFGAWLSLAATTAIFILLFDKKRRWKLVLSAALILAVIVPILIFGPLRPFIDTKLLGHGIGSFAWDVITRLDSWTFAVQTWWSHPLLGVGIGNYEILEYAHEYIHSPWGPSGSTPHQTYLYLLGQSGIVGLVSMLAILLGVVRTNLRLRTHPEFGWIAAALAFALITNLIGWFGDDSTLYGPHTSYLVWLIVGISEAVRNAASNSALQLQNAMR